MIDDLLRKIEEAIKGFFADSLISSLEKLTGDINDTVMNIGTEVAKGPQDWPTDTTAKDRNNAASLDTARQPNY